MAGMGWHMIDTTSRQKHIDAVLRMVDEDGSGALGLIALVQDIAARLKTHPSYASDSRNVKDDVAVLKARAELKDEVLPEERVFHTTYTLVERSQRMVIGDDGFLHPHESWDYAIEEATTFASRVHTIPSTVVKTPVPMTALGLEAAFPKRRKYPVIREKR